MDANPAHPTPSTPQAMDDLSHKLAELSLIIAKNANLNSNYKKKGKHYNNNYKKKSENPNNGKTDPKKNGNNQRIQVGPLSFARYVLKEDIQPTYVGIARTKYEPTRTRIRPTVRSVKMRAREKSNTDLSHPVDTIYSSLEVTNDQRVVIDFATEDNRSLFQIQAGDNTLSAIVVTASTISIWPKEDYLKIVP